MRYVQKGEVYYIKDTKYDDITKHYATTTDSHGHIVKDNTIKGNRPWIIIGISNKIVTVLPLTTKKPNDKIKHPTIYNYRKGVVSYVLFQPKTVNISELGTCLFKINEFKIDYVIDSYIKSMKYDNTRQYNYDKNNNPCRRKDNYEFKSLSDYFKNSSLYR